MIFDSDWQAERTIRRILRRLSRQRVLLGPNQGWILEKGLSRGDDKTESALITCYVRGWVELLQEAVPTAEFRGVAEAGEYMLPATMLPIWRLTDAGWGVIYRRRMFELVTFGIGIIGLLVAVIGLWPAGGIASP